MNILEDLEKSLPGLKSVLGGYFDAENGWFIERPMLISRRYIEKEDFPSKYLVPYEPSDEFFAAKYIAVLCFNKFTQEGVVVLLEKEGAEKLQDALDKLAYDHR